MGQQDLLGEARSSEQNMQLLAAGQGNAAHVPAGAAGQGESS